MNPQNQTNPTALDQDAVNMAKAIRQSESGGNFAARGKSGEYGAYQFTPSTWNNLSQKYLGQPVDLEKSTPEQQNEVAYRQIKDWKDKGYNVGQVASMWNAGEGEPEAYTGKFSNGQSSIGKNDKGVAFDVPKYVQSVAETYQNIKTGKPITTVSPSYAEPESKTGLVQRLVQSAAQPFLKVASSANALIHSGDQEKYQNIQKEGTDFGYFGKATPVGAGFDVTKGVSENVKPILEAAGTGAELASYALPVKGIKQAISAGAVMGAGSGLRETGTLSGGIKGGLLGGVLGTAGGGLAKALESLPRSLTETAFKGLTPEQATKVLNEKSIGSIDNILQQSRKAVAEGGSKIDELLKGSGNNTGYGANSIRDTLKQFPEFNKEGGVDKMLSKVKSLISNSKTIGEDRATITSYIDKIADGTATLYEKNKVRSAIDSATSGSYGKLARAISPSSGHDLAMTFADALRNEVQSVVPDTQPIFSELAKEIGIRKALAKLSAKKPGGIIRWRDILPFMTGSAIGGPLTGIGSVLAERAIENPAVQFGIAKATRAAGNVANPALRRTGLLSTWRTGRDNTQ